MGRAMLFAVLLMSTLFAGIMTSLQRKMTDVPDLVVRNLLTKEVESVCDYALRNAMRNAGSMQGLQELEGQKTFLWTFNNYHVGNCIIDSTRYTFVGSTNHYKVQTYVRGTMQGQTVSHDAEMAFNYPAGPGGGKPNVFYYEFEEFLYFPGLFDENKKVTDSSPNGYTAENSNYFITATIPWGGAFSQYTAHFPGSRYMTVGTDGSATNIDTEGNFSLVCFAKIHNGSWWPAHPNDQGTLIWIASNPNDNVMRNKPAAAIYYSTSDRSIHFETTMNNDEKTKVESVVSYHPRTAVTHIAGILYLFHANYPWISLGMSFTRGVLRSYVNGELKQTVDRSDLNCGAVPSRYGMSMGRRDLRTGVSSDREYKYFTGFLDQVGMEDRVLSDAEMLTWHQGAMFQNAMLYIRD